MLLLVENNEQAKERRKERGVSYTFVRDVSRVGGVVTWNCEVLCGIYSGGQKIHFELRDPENRATQ